MSRSKATVVHVIGTETELGLKCRHCEKFWGTLYYNRPLDFRQQINNHVERCRNNPGNHI